jgi:hypothetical protein
MSTFCHCQERVRRPAFERDVGHQSCEPARGIERSSEDVTRVEQQQRTISEPIYVETGARTGGQFRLECQELLDRLQRVALEALLVGLHRIR